MARICYFIKLEVSNKPLWRGGRAVEGARLESVYTRNCIVGSNPIPSAILDNSPSTSSTYESLRSGASRTQKYAALRCSSSVRS